ncbi:MAG: hypothetical protein JNL11_10210 [Bdellovibrionaceae bacterium]|nr:hypothetical protein [Pseudobdellovibrionaceae bacterium]
MHKVWIFEGTVSYKMNSQADYARARGYLKHYGVDRFLSNLIELGVVGSNEIILPATKPFNPFARLASGDDKPAYGNILQSLGLSESDCDFIVVKNLPVNDANWNNLEKASKGEASMGLRHRFIIPRDPYWSSFNVLTIGLGKRSNDLEKSISFLKSMKKAALDYVSKDRAVNKGSDHEWSENIGLFFHVFPFNSVQYLHLHVVDLDATGAAFGHMYHKNLNIDYVINQLELELKTKN